MEEVMMMRLFTTIALYLILFSSLIAYVWCMFNVSQGKGKKLRKVNV